MQICILSSFEDSLSRDTGYSVRIYNLARGLAELGNTVHVVIPGYKVTVEKMDRFFVYKIRGFLPKRVLYFLARVLGIAKPMTLFFYDLSFVFRIRTIIQRADIVQMEQQTAGGLLVPIITKILKKPVVVDCHDVFQSLRLEHTSKVRRVLETFFEILVYKYASLILNVSEKEKEILISCGISEEKIKVTPNGVDVDRFANLNMDLLDVKRKYGLENYRVVVFVGNMEYSPNKEAVRLIASKIAPLVCREVDNVKFLMVGRCVKRINSPNLIFTGAVRDIVEPLAISDVAIAPLFRGSGTRLKILEYLACGLSTISTTKGIEGLNLKNGTDLIIEDEVNEFAKSIIKLLKNPDLAEKLRKNAKESVMDYDWKKISAQLHETYEEFLRKESSGY
ncbi:MAG: glycosyltransferase family 4 protein [Candidatus Bathycorpusculaceae bacterium]